MRQFTRLMLIALGLAALIIGLLIFLVGPDATARIFGGLLSYLGVAEGYSGGLDQVNVDSEMRFYSVFWMAYGALLFWLVAHMEQKPTWVFAALGLFFLGGIGRLISFVFVGAPDPLFTTLMAVELAGPVVVAVAFLVGRSGEALRK